MLQAAHDTGIALSIAKQLSMDGLKLVAIKIREDMDKIAPLIPMDTGALAAGYEIRPFYKRNNSLMWKQDGCQRKYKNQVKVASL